MNLSVRMSEIVKYVPKGSKVIDVGTDHAYVPIYLRKNKIAASVLATDVNKGPLEKAAKNIAKYKVDNIALKHTSGLEGINYYVPDVVMISGMGGFLVIDIIKTSLELVNKVSRLILQPQHDIDEVRKYIHSIGFKIIDESMVYDAGKYYVVIVCEHGIESYENEYEYTYGKKLIENRQDIFKEWINMTINRNNTILENIKAAADNETSESYVRRRDELVKEINTLQHVQNIIK